MDGAVSGLQGLEHLCGGNCICEEILSGGSKDHGTGTEAGAGKAEGYPAFRG